jgi:hypothetical protein
MLVMTESVLQQAQREIEDGSPDRRESVARTWIARIAALRHPVVEKREAVSGEFRETKEAWSGKRLPMDTIPYAEREEEEKSRLLRLSAVAALTLEVLLAVFASITFLAFFWPIAAVIGVLIAVLLAVQIKGLLITKWDPELPRRSVRTLTAWVWLSFLVSIFGIAVLFFARTNLWAAPLLYLVLPILSVSLPMLAGALFVLSHVYGRFGRLERLHAQLHEQVVELDQLLRELRRYIQRREGA